MKAYQAHATGGFRAVADTPRGAAINFFNAFPTKRKCSIIEGETSEGFFTVTYGNPWPKSWNEVTKRNLDTLPDTLN